MGFWLLVFFEIWDVKEIIKTSYSLRVQKTPIKKYHSLKYLASSLGVCEYLKRLEDRDQAPWSTIGHMPTFNALLSKVSSETAYIVYAWPAARTSYVVVTKP